MLPIHYVAPNKDKKVCIRYDKISECDVNVMRLLEESVILTYRCDDASSTTPLSCLPELPALSVIKFTQHVVPISW